MKLNVAIEGAVGRSKPLTAENLINIFVEKAPPNAKDPLWLVGAPGLRLFADTGAGPIRGMHQMNGDLYVVSANELYLVNSLGGRTALGAISGHSNSPVTMADNGTQLCVVANPTGYIYTPSTGVLVAITDTDFPGASTVTYMDGYFIFSSSDGTQWFISALLDGTAYDPLDFASAESNPDPISRVWVDHRELFIFGTQSVEPWYDSGASDFPFERIPQAIIERGLGGINTIAKCDNSTFWVDQTNIVRRLGSGYADTRVSTHAIESQLSDISTATAFSYSLEGHECYVLNTTTKTFIYDASTQLWHQRKSQNMDRWRVGSCAQCYGHQLVGDYINGKIYILDLDTYTENGADLTAEIVFPPVFNGGKRFTVSEVFLDCEMGVGLVDNTDPRISLSSSENGKTWSDERTTSLGRIGEYDNRAVWRRLGQFTNMHLKFQIGSPVKRAIYTAYIQARGDDG